MQDTPEMNQPDHAQPVTVSTLAARKSSGDKIACLTAYDASFAALAERAGIDLVLVGDSLGNIVQGQQTTTRVTVDDMVYHTRCVAAGMRLPLLVADLPFLSFATIQDAVDSSRRLIGDGGAAMVKLEGSAADAGIVETLSRNGVPVCAHLGLRPQQIHKEGGFKVRGRSEAAADTLRDESRQLESAGADMLLLECVPTRLAGEIAAAANVPVIGIGAGADVDGQILVNYDAFGISTGKKPKFVRNFLAESKSLDEAASAYVDAVRNASFPAASESFED